MTNSADSDQLASQLIWIYTVCKARAYLGSAPGLTSLTTTANANGNADTNASHSAVVQYLFLYSGTGKLTHCMLGKNFNWQPFEIFSQKMRFDISCNLSHLGKIKNTLSVCCLLNLPIAWKVLRMRSKFIISPHQKAKVSKQFSKGMKQQNASHFPEWIFVLSFSAGKILMFNVLEQLPYTTNNFLDKYFACWVKNSADNILIFFLLFHFFLENRNWQFMQIVPSGDNLHELSDPIFW